MRGLQASGYLTQNLKKIIKRGLLLKEILIYKFNSKKQAFKVSRVYFVKYIVQMRTTYQNNTVVLLKQGFRVHFDNSVILVNYSNLSIELDTFLCIP